VGALGLAIGRVEIEGGRGAPSIHTGSRLSPPSTARRIRFLSGTSGTVTPPQRFVDLSTQRQEETMPKEAHTKAAEHHETAAKSHRTAAEHHGKGDHTKGREEASKAQSHSKTAREQSEMAHGKSHSAK
jgi:hypothetical protein